MAKIFISYRRDDAQWPADRIYRSLKPFVANPAADLFMDVDSMPLGLDFVEHLRKTVRQCDILIALIGPGWLNAIDRKTGGRRLLDEADYVRVEVAAALAQNVRVVPVLLDGTPFPPVADLPDNLKQLVTRAGVEVRRLSFDSDVDRLVQGLGLVATGTREPKRIAKSSWWSGYPIWIGAIALLAIVATAVFLNLPKAPAEPPSPSAVAFAKVEPNDPAGLRAFLQAFAGSPEAVAAEKSLREMDDAEWSAAHETGTIQTLATYLKAFPTDAIPPGVHADRAAAMQSDYSVRIQRIQEALVKAGLLSSRTDGVLYESTVRAAALFGAVTAQDVPDLNLVAIETLEDFAGLVESWDRKPAKTYTSPIVPIIGPPTCTTQPEPFTVYFEYDREELTENNRTIIAQAMSRARAGGCAVTLVQIEARNAFSRAQAVKQALIDEGLPAEQIRIEGNLDDAKPVAPGVREPLNRRVVVQITIGD